MLKLFSMQVADDRNEEAEALRAAIPMNLDNSRNLIEVFVARCEARARLWGCFLMDLQIAVDELQESAERDGLVQALGQDAVQALMADAFRRWRREC